MATRPYAAVIRFDSYNNQGGDNGWSASITPEGGYAMVVRLEFDQRRTWTYATYQATAISGGKSQWGVIERGVPCMITLNDRTGNNMIEIRIREHTVVHEEGESVTRFDQPTRFSDVVLVVGGRKIHVNKTFLVMHCKYFDKLFFGDFAEQNKDEIELKDLDYDQFVDFLRALYPERHRTSAANVQARLSMANYFGCQAVLHDCVVCLETSLDLHERLLLADRHHLADVVDRCLQDFSPSRKQFLKLYEFGYDKFSDPLKVRLFGMLGEHCKKHPHEGNF